MENRRFNLVPRATLFAATDWNRWWARRRQAAAALPPPPGKFRRRAAGFDGPASARLAGKGRADRPARLLESASLFAPCLCPPPVSARRAAPPHLPPARKPSG